MNSFNCIFSFFIIIIFSSITAIPETKPTMSSKEIVRGFLTEVRSGLNPGKAAFYMADTVLAHQVNSENPVTIERSPANYTAHVQDFLKLFGEFKFELTELIAEDDKVYARWIQYGIHRETVDAFKATGLPLVEYTSAVYRVQKEKIVEYWLQSDRFGFEQQLRKNVEVAKSK